MVEGYCLKCKKKSEMKNSEQVKMKNGRPAMKGECAKCATKMFKILPSAGGPKKGKAGAGTKSKKSKKSKKSTKSKKSKKSKKAKKVMM